MASPFIYVNAPLPTEFDPPRIARRSILAPEALRALVQSNDVSLESQAEGSIAERILALFQLPQILLGDPGFIPANRDAWLARFNHFIAEGKPIEFVSMAFAYKSPNPLKTEREAPDLGEALMLRRFAAILDAVATIYPTGGRLTILEEGILGRCQGVPPARIAAYRAGTGAIAAVAGIDPVRIVFHSLDDMGERIPNFEARWIFEQERLRELWENGDPAIRSAYETTVTAQRASVPTLDYDPAVLVAAYDSSKTDSALRYPREYIDKVSHRQFFAYRALLALRDVTGYLHDLRPYAIKLTVSPKPENLAVIPINNHARILPYHGIPVLRGDGAWQLLYRAEIGGLGAVEALHLDGDPDPAPIGYRVLG
jgi:hypothetical protein